MVMKKLIRGVGISDADYPVRPLVSGKKVICPYYKTWTDMLRRCYSPEFHSRYPTYKGCEVSRNG